MITASFSDTKDLLIDWRLGALFHVAKAVAAILPPIMARLAGPPQPVLTPRLIFVFLIHDFQGEVRSRRRIYPPVATGVTRYPRKKRFTGVAVGGKSGSRA